MFFFNYGVFPRSYGIIIEMMIATRPVIICERFHSHHGHKHESRLYWFVDFPQNLDFFADFL